MAMMDDDDRNDWDELEKMLEQWILTKTSGYRVRQSLIPIRDFIFDRTTEGRKSSTTTRAGAQDR